MKIPSWSALTLCLVLVGGCVPDNGQPNATAPATAQSPDSSAATPASPSPALTAESIAQSGTPVGTQSGRFVAGEHSTQGTVRLVTQNGQTTIELGEDFVTSELGPDLVVILHRSSDVIGSTQPPAYPINAGDYVVVAPLQQFQGAQRYVVPADVNLADYRSVGIWCRKFNAMFGAAALGS